MNFLFHLLLEKQIILARLVGSIAHDRHCVLCACSVTAAFLLAARGRTSNMRISWNKREFQEICVDVASFV